MVIIALIFMLDTGKGVIDMYTIWCEWDVGQEGTVFLTLDSAKNWVNNNIHLQEMIQYEYSDDEDVKEPLDFVELGLVTFNKVDVVD